MFCPTCGANQGERRFCTACGTNLAAVSQALHSPVAPLAGQAPSGSQYLPPPTTPYDLERQREYASGWKLLMLGSVALSYNILKILFSFGHSSFGFWGFIGLVLFAIGLSKVLSWRQMTGMAPHAVVQTVPPVQQQPPVPAPTPNTAQLQRPPQPVFSALQPGTRTDEIEAARLTNYISGSATEDETLQLPSQKANWKME
jgi:hypothetical protein